MPILITGTGRCVPDIIVPNEQFFNHEFYDADGKRIPQSNDIIIEKFKGITGIAERRYANGKQVTSDLAFIAAARAIEDAAIDPETLDGLIVAHNFGNIPIDTVQSDAVPSLAARVKHSLRIRNPACTAFDVLYGCPGWIQSVIIARQALLCGAAKRYLVIGAETLSRVIDPHDRDSMIYSDGAAATVLEMVADAAPNRGILSVVTHTYAADEAYFLGFGGSYKAGFTPSTRYIKMQGRKIYEFALSKVPVAMKSCLDEAGVAIADVKKIFIHQANEKMDDAILSRFFGLYGITELPQDIMPMSIHLFGNSSVATVPTLLDLVFKGEQHEHKLHEGDVILMASVGAGMNINAITYRM